MRVKIKNFGKTPAYHPKVEYIVKAVNWKDGRPDEIPSLDTLDASTEPIGDMGPTDYFEFEDDELSTKNATEDQLRNFTKVIYLVGRISYDTAFRRGHKTRFRFYVGGGEGWDGPGEMNADREVNDST